MISSLIYDFRHWAQIDGEAANFPLSDEICEETEIFLRTLPDDIPTPEFCMNDGKDLSVDWLRSRNQGLSLSIRLENKRIPYAWINGDGNHGYGVANFDGIDFPDEIHEKILEIMK
jgi:hypothetical protein